MGWGKGCIRFWGRSDQNSGFYGNRKTYNGETVVRSIARSSFLIGSSSYLQIIRAGIKSRRSSNLGEIGLFGLELLALERRKKSHRLLMDNALTFDRIIFELAGNQDSHKISDEFELRTDRTIDFGVTCP